MDWEKYADWSDRANFRYVKDPADEIRFLRILCLGLVSAKKWGLGFHICAVNLFCTAVAIQNLRLMSSFRLFSHPILTLSGRLKIQVVFQDQKCRSVSK